MRRVRKPTKDAVSNRVAGDGRAPPIRVMIVDDHVLLTESIGRYLDERGDLRVVATAVDGDEAVRLIRQVQPEVLILDVELPGRSGVEVAAAIPVVSPATRILVLTGHRRPEDVRSLVGLGVHGYLFKGTLRLRRLIASVQAVHAGQVVYDADVASLMASSQAPAVVTPTARELETLRLIAHGLRAKEVALALNIKPRTVRFHLANLAAKLRATSQAQLVGLGRQYGWLSALAVCVWPLTGEAA